MTVCLFSNSLFPKCQDFEKSEQELNKDTYLLYLLLSKSEPSKQNPL